MAKMSEEEYSHEQLKDCYASALCMFNIIDNGMYYIIYAMKYDTILTYTWGREYLVKIREDYWDAVYWFSVTSHTEWMHTCVNKEETIYG